MLSKQICKRCIKKYEYKWSILDDMRWEKNRLLCPFGSTSEKFYYQDVDISIIFDNCPYRLEHIVNVE